MPALVPPRLEVVAHGDALHAVLFRRDRDLDEFAGIELLGRRLVSEGEAHEFILSGWCGYCLIDERIFDTIVVGALLDSYLSLIG